MGNESNTSQPIAHFERLRIAGRDLSLPPNGVVAFVGPNNVGKSTALGELKSYVQSGVFTHNNKPARVITDGHLELPDRERFQAWLAQFIDVKYVDPVHPQMRRYRNWGGGVLSTAEEMSTRLEMAQQRGELANFLLSEGVGVTFDTQAPDIYNTSSMPGVDNEQMNRLFLDPAVEKRIADLSRQIFNVPVSLNRYGRMASLHFGTVPSLGSVVTEADLQEVLGVPRVSEQGLGVTTLLTTAISLELGQEPLVVLDEPDAHLHPPTRVGAGMA